jgi:tRNA threonylcarbamoyl adenosine modification protein YeaZ
MNILGIDTSLEACSVGLAIGDESNTIVRTETVGRGHDEHLFAMVESVLAEGGLAIADIDRFAVTIGPGSFTGIRVGVAAVRGFALVAGAPAVGLSTLAVLAESARLEAADRPVLANLPAKGDEVFAQLFAAGGEATTEPAVLSLGEAAALAVNSSAVLAGAGAAMIAAARPESGLAVIHQQSVPDMLSLLRLAERATMPQSSPKPLYVKPPDAKPAPAMLARR